MALNINRKERNKISPQFCKHQLSKGLDLVVKVPLLLTAPHEPKYKLPESVLFILNIHNNNKNKQNKERQISHCDLPAQLEEHEL